MSEIRLTSTSYVILGLLEQVGEATPYELKAMVAAGVGHLWSLQHAQVYAEPERLAGAGLVTEQREQGGRRRKRYRLTDRGREALRAWLAEPTREFTELRDPGLLKLYFGAEPALLAGPQLEIHAERLRAYEQLREQLASQGAPDGPRLALESGIGHEREWVRFWRRLAERRG